MPLLLPGVCTNRVWFTKTQIIEHFSNLVGHLLTLRRRSESIDKPAPIGFPFANEMPGNSELEFQPML